VSEESPKAPRDNQLGRRGAIRLIVASGAIGSVLVSVPAGRMLLAPGREGDSSARWVKTVRFDSLKEGEPLRVVLVADRKDAWTLERDVELGNAWLVRRGAAVAAFSATCPHLGCAIDRAARSSGGFTCPCHDSSFDADGRCLDGPSPRDLDRLETRLEGGFVLVDFRRFCLGTPERVAIG
jgi:cytochrome b6-f complex iron-sulfur subunit/menaquinol-cytochrome c reductase iron-sulfur subunit